MFWQYSTPVLSKTGLPYIQKFPDITGIRQSETVSGRKSVKSFFPFFAILRGAGGGSSITFGKTKKSSTFVSGFSVFEMWQPNSKNLFPRSNALANYFPKSASVRTDKSWKFDTLNNFIGQHSTTYRYVCSHNGTSFSSPRRYTSYTPQRSAPES